MLWLQRLKTHPPLLPLNTRDTRHRILIKMQKLVGAN